MTRKEKKENCQIRASISLRFLSNDFNPQKKPHKKKKKKTNMVKQLLFVIDYLHTCTYLNLFQDYLLKQTKFQL